MSWKMLLVVAALAIPAVGCKTLSNDGQDPAKPAVTEEKAAEPAAVGDPAKADPAKADPAKTIEETKATGETKTEEGKATEPAPEGKTAEGGEADPQ